MACSRSRKLPRRLVIKIFNPRNASCQTRVILAGAGRHFTEEGIDGILESTAEEIEKLMPGQEYHLVELRETARFNFVWVGEKPGYVDPRAKAIFDGSAAPAHA